MCKDQLNLLKPSLLDDLPNTYTYTKGLAEYVLLKEAADLPTSIMRPAIFERTCASMSMCDHVEY